MNANAFNFLVKIRIDVVHFMHFEINLANRLVLYKKRDIYNLFRISPILINCFYETLSILSIRIFMENICHYCPYSTWL